MASFLRPSWRTTVCRSILLSSRDGRTYATTTPTGTQDPLGYCLQLVQKQDYEGFLSYPFYPKAAQPGYLALKAFQIELASIHDTVSNPLIGRMRIQFWRDAVKSLADNRPVQHPVVMALHKASQQTRLAPYHLNRVINARDSELDSPAHLTVDALTAHAESTSSTLLYLLLAVLRLNARDGAGTAYPSSLSEPHSHNPSVDPYDPDTLSHAASHLGVAQSVATLLRALPYHASKSRMVIPADITAKHGVVQEDVFRRGGAARNISDAVYEFACLAQGHLNSAREMFAPHGSKVPERAFPVFMSGIPVAAFLERLEAVNFDAFDPGLSRRNWKLPWRMWRSQYTHKF